jgi:hypothetical protein
LDNFAHSLCELFDAEDCFGLMTLLTEEKPDLSLVTGICDDLCEDFGRVTEILIVLLWTEVPDLRRAAVSNLFYFVEINELRSFFDSQQQITNFVESMRLHADTADFMAHMISWIIDRGDKERRDSVMKVLPVKELIGMAMTSEVPSVIFRALLILATYARHELSLEPFTSIFEAFGEVLTRYPGDDVFINVTTFFLFHVTAWCDSDCVTGLIDFPYCMSRDRRPEFVARNCRLITISCKVYIREKRWFGLTLSQLMETVYDQELSADTRYASAFWLRKAVERHRQLSIDIPLRDGLVNMMLDGMDSLDHATRFNMIFVLFTCAERSTAEVLSMFTSDLFISVSSGLLLDSDNKWVGHWFVDAWNRILALCTKRNQHLEVMERLREALPYDEVECYSRSCCRDLQDKWEAFVSMLKSNAI